MSPLHWNRLTPREKALSAMVIGTIFYVAIAFFYYPNVRESKGLSNEKETLEREVASLTSTLPVLHQKAQSRKRAEPSPRREIVFSNEEGSLSRVLEEIGRLARIKQVRLIEVKPSVAEKREDYEILPIQVKVHSRFRNVGEYLLALERLPRPIVIRFLKIETDAQMSPDVEAEMTLHIYKKGGA